MPDSGYVYAKFFSEAHYPEGFAILALPPEQVRGGLGEGSADARRFIGAGHAQYELRMENLPVARFWAGSEGACVYGGAEYPLPEGTGFMFGVSFLQPEKGDFTHARLLCALLACFQERQASREGGRLILCSPVALGESELEASGLYLIATYDSLVPGVKFRPIVRRLSLPENIVYELRTRMPLLAILAARVVSASPIRRYLIEGSIDNAPLRISFNGSKKLAGYYSGVIFPNGASSLRPQPLLTTLDRSSFDIEFQWYARRSCAVPEGIVLPAFSRSILRVGPSFSAFLDSLPKSAKSDLNKIRAGNFESFVSREFLDFLLFYHSMYLPMLASRHSEHSLHMTFSELSKLFNSGFILFVKRGASPVGGVISSENKGILLTKILGIASGSFVHTLQGANVALVYHMIKYAYDQGLKIVDFGYSSPFGCDGVLKFKLKWGAKVVADRNTDLLRLSFRDEGARQLFFSKCAPLQLDSLEVYDPEGISP